MKLQSTGVLFLAIWCSGMLYGQSPVMKYGWQGKYGLTNPNGDLIAEPIYDKLRYRKDLDVYEAESDGLSGLLDRSGKLVIPLKYTSISVQKSYIEAIYPGWAKKDYYDLKFQQIDEVSWFERNPRFRDGMAVVRNKEGKYGVGDSTGKLIIPFEYDQISGRPVVGRFMARKGDAWAVVGMDNKPLTEFKFDRPYYSAGNGRFLIQGGGKAGILGRDGKVAIEPKFDGLHYMGRDVYAYEDGKLWGMIAADGTTTTAPKYTNDWWNIEAWDDYFFEYGIGAVRLEDGSYQYIDPGAKVVSDTYDYADVVFSANRSQVVRDGKTGFVDTTGKVAIPLVYTTSRYGWNISEKCKRLLVQKDGKYGIIDDNGNEIIPVQYTFLESSGCGRDDIVANLDGAWGIVGKDGGVKIPLKYEQFKVRWYQNPIDFVLREKSSGKYGVIDSNYNTLVDFKYEYLSKNYDGYRWCSWVEGKDTLAGMIGPEGQLIRWKNSPPDAALGTIKHGSGIFRLPNMKYGALNLEGAIQIPAQYESLAHTKWEGYFLARLHGKLGVIDDKGRVVIPFDYTNIQFPYDGERFEDLPAIMVFNKKSRGLISPKGDMLMAMSDEKITPFGKGFVKVEMADRYIYGLRSIDGREVLEMKYSSILPSYTKSSTRDNNPANADHSIAWVFWVGEDGKGNYCYVDSSGAHLLPGKYR